MDTPEAKFDATYVAVRDRDQTLINELAACAIRFASAELAHNWTEPDPKPTINDVRSHAKRQMFVDLNELKSAVTNAITDAEFSVTHIDTIESQVTFNKSC